ncbi:uncharacterized protein LOC123271049 [Cotesia glomerata]|uniref:uncharacterized protein LOC123271049 n=1 Tax=Cotesia glomerata TaxID=32391 RepID=UPI001D014E03|nr:uncharacterized protein LOC123271049 [Cotesia glomerata]
MVRSYLPGGTAVLVCHKVVFLARYCFLSSLTTFRSACDIAVIFSLPTMVQFILLVKYPNLINASKTKAMILGSAFNVNLIQLDQTPALVLAGEDIEYVISFKYLGVILDPRLSWVDQVARTCSTASIMLYRLRQSVNELNINLKRQIVTSLVLPVFDYCAVALTNLNLNLEKKLTVTLNNCVRFVLRKRRGEHISEPRLDLEWLSPYNRRCIC